MDGQNHIMPSGLPVLPTAPSYPEYSYTPVPNNWLSLSVYTSALYFSKQASEMLSHSTPTIFLLLFSQKAFDFMILHGSFTLWQIGYDGLYLFRYLFNIFLIHSFTSFFDI